MKRKRIILATLVVFATLFGAKATLLAQKSQDNKANRITEHMVKKLDLSQEQKELVYAINLEKVEARQNLKRDDSNLSRKERKQQFKVKAEEWKSDLKTVLNEEQIKKLRIK